MHLSFILQEEYFKIHETLSYLQHPELPGSRVPGPRTVKFSYHLLLVPIQLVTCMLSVPCHHAMYVIHYFVSSIM